MPVDLTYLGREYPPTPPYEVSREKIREFASAVGDTSPACHDVAAARALGYPDLVAPPTFPIVLTLPAGSQVTQDPGFGIDYSKVVHGEQRFVNERPVFAGDVLQVVVVVHDIRAAAGNDIVTTKSTVRTLDGNVVSSAYSTIVARGTAVSS